MNYLGCRSVAQYNLPSFLSYFPFILFNLFLAPLSIKIQTPSPPIHCINQTSHLLFQFKMVSSAEITSYTINTWICFLLIWSILSVTNNKYMSHHSLATSSCIYHHPWLPTSLTVTSYQPLVLVCYPHCLSSAPYSPS